jgi:hypothetical protein
MGAGGAFLGLGGAFRLGASDSLFLVGERGVADRVGVLGLPQSGEAGASRRVDLGGGLGHGSMLLVAAIWSPRSAQLAGPGVDGSCHEK